jgi:hypothetical protein
VFVGSRPDQAVRCWFLVCYDWLQGHAMDRTRSLFPFELSSGGPPRSPKLRPSDFGQLRGLSTRRSDWTAGWQI